MTGIWEKLKVSPSLTGRSESGLWQELAAKVDPTRYVPQKIGAVEERQLASQRSGNYFVVKNREKIRYLKLTEQDHFLWNRIDGKTSFGDLVMEYFQKFGSFAFNRISTLLDQLRTNYFLEEQPARIFSRLTHEKEKTSLTGKVMQGVRSFVHKEIPISHLDRLVTLLYQALFRPLFSRVAKWLYLLLTVAGIACFVSILHSGNYAIIQTGGSYTVGIVVLIALQVFIILLHEGAHAFSAKSYGREVPRGGFMIYMGMPAFFVDTTDMWLEPKGKRIAVSWAGPYSELVVGGLFSLILVLFPEFPANPILFKCAFLFYIGVFINLNPLLELDGYYMLVDLLEMPLLRRRSLKFVKKELWRKIAERESFSREEKIFTVFGTLAGAYTAFALTVAVYFWQTRIATTFAELWDKGIFAKLLVVVLVFSMVAPIALFLVLKTMQLLRWIWNKIASSPMLREIQKASPLLAAAGILFWFFGVWQPWVDRTWIFLLGTGALVLIGAHFLYQGRKLLFPANPWQTLILFALSGTFFWLLQTALGMAGLDEGKSLSQLVCLVLFGLASLRSFRHLQKQWAWPILFLWGAFAATATPILFPQWEWESSLAFCVLSLLALLSFAIGVAQASSLKMQVRHTALESDEEKLEQAFFSVLACIRRFFQFIFSRPTADRFWEKWGSTAIKEIPEIQKGEAGFVFRANLSILEKAAAARKMFDLIWAQIVGTLGSQWAQSVLERTFDVLDWQEREILDQYVFTEEDARKNLVRLAAAGRRGLESILQRNFLFADLSPEEISRLSELFIVEPFSKGDEIIRQGDVGDKFYLIKEGRVLVRIKRQNGVEEEVARLGEGDFFGEIALLKEVPRTATCVAESDVTVWSLDKTSFTQYVKERFQVSESVERAIEIVRLISSMPLFRELNPSQLRQLALRFASRAAAAGEKIIRQGEPGEEFFVIEKGECAVKIKGPGGEEKTVAKLKKGEYFGEMALLSQAPRSATVEAVTPAELLVLSKKDFDLLIKSTLQAGGSLEKLSSRRKLDLKKKALAGV